MPGAPPSAQFPLQPLMGFSGVKESRDGSFGWRLAACTPSTMSALRLTILVLLDTVSGGVPPFFVTSRSAGPEPVLARLVVLFVVLGFPRRPGAGRSGRRFPATVPGLFQRDGEVGNEQQVVVAQDHFQLGAGFVQAQRAPGFGRDGDDTAAGLDGHEPQAFLHGLRLSGQGLCYRNTGKP